MGYDRWLEDARIALIDELGTIEAFFRLTSQANRTGAKDWTDSYLIAFAQAAGFLLIEFDQRVHQRAIGATLLHGG